MVRSSRVGTIDARSDTGAVPALCTSLARPVACGLWRRAVAGGHHEPSGWGLLQGWLTL